jgi:hypothetical protein
MRRVSAFLVRGVALMARICFLGRLNLRVTGERCRIARKRREHGPGQS